MTFGAKIAAGLIGMGFRAAAQGYIKQCESEGKEVPEWVKQWVPDLVGLGVTAWAGAAADGQTWEFDSPI